MKTHKIFIFAMFITLILLLSSCELEFENDEWSFGNIGITLLDAKYTGENSMELRYRAKDPYYGLSAHIEINGKTQKYRMDRQKSAELYDTWRFKETWTVTPNWLQGDTITIYDKRGAGSVSFNVP